MAEVAAIGWAVSPIIKLMVGKVHSYLGSQYNWQKKMKEDLWKLESTLIQLQSVVAVAKRRQVKDANQAALLQQLKDTVYEADNLLDEFEYQTMEARAKKAEGMVSHATSSSIKLAKRLVGQDKLHAKLTEILEKLDVVNKTADRFIQVAGLDKNIPIEQVEIESRRITGSILPSAEIFGRDMDKVKLVSLLLETGDEAESSNRNIPVVTIVGEGGVGKTTLCQYVCNDEVVKEHFELMMWVCVSNGFNKIRLTNEMLESASGRHEDFRNYDAVSRNLEAMLKCKKFLLVLDDVWYDEEVDRSENEGRWIDLFDPLQAGARESKILVTTREGKVADMFGPRHRCELKGLAKSEYWELFARCAFGNGNPGDHPELQQIGEKIIERLNGSPLAAKVIGGLLKDSADAEQWRSIWDRLKVGNIPAYRLAYERLPEYLKPCFAYCSIFPKNWLFEPKKLVLLWIAQGYIQDPDTNNKPIADIGMDSFNELLSRFFFEKVERRSRTYYVIHDLIHDVAQSIAKDECSRIDSAKQSTIKNTIRHLGIVVDSRNDLRDILTQLEKMSNVKNVRTIIFFYGPWMNLRDLPQGIFKKAKSLRVLDFSEFELQEFPRYLGHLLHLRYLNLGRNSFENLPKSSCKLYHLQVLVAYEQLQLSKGMFRLINFGRLTYFDVEELELQVEKNRGHGMGVLEGGMNVVFQGEVCIKNLDNVASEKEATKADLKSKQYLYRLRLEWGSSGRTNTRHDASEKVVEALKPHQNLKELTIVRFGGISSPSWLQTELLINLQTICLLYCQNLEALPPLGHLPLLKKLHIEGMHAIKRVGSEFYGCNDNENEVVRVGFPSLEVLYFDNMPEWSEWSEVEFPVFPHLHELTVLRSPKLGSLPQGAFASLVTLHIDFWTNLASLPSLRHLSVGGCSSEAGSEVVLPPSLESLVIIFSVLSDASLSRCLEGLTSLSKLSIQICTGLTSLPSAQLLHRLTALQQLTASNCENLTSLGGLHALDSLKRLSVGSCPGLKSLPEERLPASVEHLSLHGCDPALQQQIQEKAGPEWDKVAHIPHVNDV